MADHTLLSRLKIRLNISDISIDDFNDLLNEYLTSQETLHELDTTGKQGVALLLLAQADFYEFLSLDTAARMKYKEATREVDETTTSEHYLELAKLKRAEADDILSSTTGSAAALGFLRLPEDERADGLTKDVNSPYYVGEDEDDVDTIP